MFKDQICLVRKEILECVYRLKWVITSADYWAVFWVFVVVGFVRVFRESSSFLTTGVCRTGTFRCCISVGALRVSAPFSNLGSGSMLTIIYIISVVYPTLHHGGRSNLPQDRIGLLFTARNGVRCHRRKESNRPTTSVITCLTFPCE